MIIVNKTITFVDALHSLSPNAEWSIVGSNYNDIEWLNPNEPQPSIDEINSEIARLQTISDTTQYQRLREQEYPDFRLYLDGIVKGDQNQVQEYINACISVKEKYPKPNIA